MQNLISKVAHALTFIDLEFLDMGDSHKEIVKEICYEGNVEFDEDKADEDENYLQEKSVEAYISCLETDSVSWILSFIDCMYDNLDNLVTRMVFTRIDAGKVHPTVEAAHVIDEYISKISSDIPSDVYFSKAKEIKETLESIDIELCYVAHDIGYSYFRYLDPEYYFISNTCFTVGHILCKDESEYDLGEYILHASLRNKNNYGYTVAFRREDENIMAHIYEHHRDIIKSYIVNYDTGIKLQVNHLNIDAFAKELAKNINKLTKEKEEAPFD